MTPVRFQVAVPGLIGAAIAAAIDVLYVLAIESQGTPVTQGVVLAVAGLILVAATAAAAGSLAPDGGRVLLTIATVLLFILGFVGIFSIGLPLLVAGILTLVATCLVRTDSSQS